MGELADRPSSWLNFVSYGGLASLGISAVLFQLAKLQDGRVFELDRAQALETLASICRPDHILPLLVAVRGRITCREPAVCQLSGVPAVMRELVEEEVYFKEQHTGRTSQECFEIRREQEQREAFLEDRTGSIRLENLQHASGLPGVMEVKQEFRHADLLQGTLLQAVLSKALKSMVKHGVRVTERYLPVDTAVTVVGELVADCMGSTAAAAAGCRTRPAAGGSGNPLLASSSQQQPSDVSGSGVEAAAAADVARTATGGGGGTGSLSAAATAVAAAAGAELLGQAALQALPYTLRMPGRGPFHVTTLTLPQLRASLERTSGVIRAFAWGFGLLGAALFVRKAAQAYHRLQAYRRYKRYAALAEAARRTAAAGGGAAAGMGTSAATGATAGDDDGDGVRSPGTVTSRTIRVFRP
ncbi:hypothetical protein VOLCADRAFT_96908 [Volvox carteri f. nagariensis]|uniref:RING-type E3 ubiquitin transferase n=1 Tax=Volvox carteri f. nagariensis TaxID=3068 RepID=D8UBA6_VOLCA|nr:uncharacterized protein VOLCADRAFT_96908 [Volvox carteri f. nagariensis]EFJ42969.1 hypothetical protein VOLCADRAFT_96908 [Volvox carteri f. nagariensis]|eukprot:XP_002956009.1 hypothetical protein VOLCADRAFT_96908 [Volvox carteri f. nagariensis]